MVKVEAAPGHLDLLRDVVAVIASPAEVEDAIAAWAEVVAVRFADVVRVHAVDVTEGMRTVAGADQEKNAPTDAPRTDLPAWEAAVHDALASRRPRRLGVSGRGALVVPVVVQDEVVGAVSFLSDDTRRWSRRVERGTAEVLAGTLAHPLAFLADRAAAAAGRGVVAGSVAAAPSLPAVAGLEVAMRVRSASRSGPAVWTDVVPLAGNRTALVAGQVGVRGHAGAELSHRLQLSVRALAAVDLPSDVLLRHLSGLVRSLEPGVVVTCVYAVHDAARRCVTVANAGHAPPLLVPPEEGAGYRAVASAIGAPLGLGSRGVREVEVRLPKGAVLALPAGGIVEGDRLSVLGEQVARSDAVHLGALDEVVVELLEADSVAGASGLLLARATGTGVDHRDVPLPDGPEAARVARRAVRELQEPWALGADTAAVELLTTELVTNAVRHARPPFALRLQLRGRTLVGEVADGSMRAPVPRVVGWGDEQGRGLMITAQLGGRWGYRQLAEGKVVWFEIDLAD